MLYVQYTNPGAYPPLEHSAHLLADAGFEVVMLGTRRADDPLAIADHARVRVLLRSFQPGGWRQKAHYARFLLWVVWWTLRWRPDWIYASDPLSCPAVLLAQRLTGTKTVYHEHDAPDGTAGSGFMRRVLRARQALAARAELCVIPNEQRADEFRQSVGGRRLITVWNTPSRAEVADEAATAANDALRVIYHGSIVPARLPETVIQALADLPASVTLDVIGYETAGHSGYVRELERLAHRLGIAHRLRFHGPMARSELMRRRGADVGLALVPTESFDSNTRAMVGASNKAFDYMASGLAILVPDASDWRTTYVDPGFGLACDPASSESIAAALRWFVEHRDLTAAMGERGRRKILDEWHYERMFAPVLARMTAARV